MSSATLYRLSGVALVLGAVLFGIGTILRFTLFPGNMAVTLMGSFGSLLLLMGLIGLPGIFTRQAQTQAQAPHAGWLGFVGFILAFTGVFLYASYFIVTTLLFLPWLAQADPTLARACSVMGGCSFGNGPQVFFIYFLVAGLMFAVGGILLGIAIILARILPLWSGLLLFPGFVLIPVLFFPLNGIIGFLNKVISFIVDTLVSGLPYLVLALLSLAVGCIVYVLITRSREAAKSSSAP